MTYATRHYAEALHGALKGKDASGRSESVRRFMRILQKNRDGKKLGQIIARYEEIALADEGAVKIHIETPRKATEDLKRSIEAAIGKPAVFTEAVDPGLLAGVRLVINDRILIDRTAAKSLRKIFTTNR